MKILNINSYYFSSSVHKCLQDALLENQIESISYVPLAKKYVPRDECKYNDATNVIMSYCYNNIDRFAFHIKQRKIYYNFQELIELNDVKCLHAHSLFSNGYIPWKIKQRFNLPYIVAVRDTDINVFFKNMIHLRCTGIEILKKADRVVFLSKPYRNVLINRYVPESLREKVYNKSIIIPNGIDSFWLKNKGQKKHLTKENKLKILYVGAINKRKNILSSVRAIEILKKRGYDIKFTIVGKIQDKKIYDRIKDLPYLIYFQPVKKEELINIYRENDIFVMPSITETFGLVYAEAMSQGLPVIYTKGQGFDEHFDEGKVGYGIINCYDEEEIANKIVNIISNYEAISENCIEMCDKFDWNQIAQIYINIYNEIVKQ